MGESVIGIGGVAMVLHIFLGLPASDPQPSVLQGFCVKPKSRFRIAGSHHLSKHPFALIFTIHNLEVSPA